MPGSATDDPQPPDAGARLLVSESEVRPGDVATLTLVAPGAPHPLGGVDSYFHAEQDDGSWRITHVMFSPTGAGRAPSTVPLTEVMAIQAIGLRGPVKVEIPDVATGRYRIERRFVTGGRITSPASHLTLYAFVNVVP